MDSDLKQVRRGAVVFLFSFAPYTLLSLLYGWANQWNGGWGDFWLAMGILVAGSIAYLMLGLVSSTLSWRAFGKKDMSKAIYSVLSAAEYPLECFESTDLDDFLEQALTNNASNKKAIRQAASVAAFGQGAGLAGPVASIRYSAAAQDAYRKLRYERTLP